MAPVIGRATLLKGAVSFKDAGIANLGDTYRGPILLPTGDTPMAIVKSLPLRELANEVYAAALALTLGLAVPRAFLVYSADGDLPVGNAPVVEGGSLVFASTDVASPSVAQIVVRDVAGHDAAIDRVAKAIVHAGRAGQAYCFDAWSANVDRHPGNWLFGPSGSWLIDHGRCFTGDTWAASDLRSAYSYRHRLREWLTPRLTEAERDALNTESHALASSLIGLDVRTIGNENAVPALVGNADFEALVTFLIDRVPHAARISAEALNRLA